MIKNNNLIGCFFVVKLERFPSSNYFEHFSYREKQKPPFGIKLFLDSCQFWHLLQEANSFKFQECISPLSFDENVTSKIKCISISFIWLEVIAFAIHYFFFLQELDQEFMKFLALKCLLHWMLTSWWWLKWCYKWARLLLLQQH